MLGKQVTLTATGGVLYAWSTGSLFDTTIVQPTATTQYCVLASDTNWCLDSACVTVNVETPCGQYYLPNAFSPNGDGFNDYFLVRTNIDCVVKMDLSVFDRWGEKVADLTNPTAQWDGSFRGKPLEQAVFIYYLTIEFTDGSKVAKTGNVTLVR